MARAMILLVSGQPMANLLAALDPDLDVTHADMIVSGDMEVGGQAENLARALMARGVTVNTHHVDDAFQPEATRSVVTALVKDAPERFILNLTGGTKPMVLGAYRAALDWSVRDLLYMDHETAMLRWLDGNRPPQPSRAQMDTKLILQAHGFQSQAGALPSQSLVQLAHGLHAQLHGDALKYWNILFSRMESLCKEGWQWAAKNVVLQQIDFRENLTTVCSLLDHPLRQAAAMGFCAWDGASVRVERPDDHQLLHGGWFELVVHDTLSEERAALGLEELSLNLKVRGPDGGSNEFDCVARRGSQLMFFEVKTAQMAGYHGAARPKEIFYKLSALKGSAGLTGRACLVSVEPMAANMAKRFAGIGLGLVQGEDASPARLRPALANWVSTA